MQNRYANGSTDTGWTAGQITENTMPFIAIGDRGIKICPKYEQSYFGKQKYMLLENIWYW